MSPPSVFSPMETFASLALLCMTTTLILLFQTSHSKTIVVAELANWTKSSPTVHVGDTLFFKYKQPLHDLYIFRNKSAFEHCDFTGATVLSNDTSQSYTWNPSRTGFFYFSFSNKSLGGCKGGEKAAIRVILSDLKIPGSAPTDSPSIAPSPTAGGSFKSNPKHNWPSRQHMARSPAPSPGDGSPMPNPPSMLPDSGGAIPLINSNPAIPLPTGETDATTIRPFPTNSYGHKVVVVGLLRLQMHALCIVLLASILI